MIYAAIYVLMLLVLLDRVNCLRLSTMVFRYQCRLFEVRDHLREGAIRGVVDPSHWVFQYLDSTIVKSIDNLDKATLWRLASLALTGPDERTRRAVQALEAELSKPKNEYMRKVYHAYFGYLMLYLLDRHWILKGAFKAASFGRVLQSKFQRAASIAVSDPETSTLAEFAPA